MGRFLRDLLRNAFPLPERGMLFWLGAFILMGVAEPVHAAKIGEISKTNLAEQALRFFTFQDVALRYALLGSILLGISCGLLGSFIVVRKMALMGDALSHAVLPGVAMGFIWQATKDPVAIFVGATLAGLLGTMVIGLITRTTRIKEDTAIGMVLAAFFSVGICLVTMIQHLPTGNKSGIDKFLFGQAAAISVDDVRLMLIVTVLVVVAVAVFYKEFLVTSFDAGFARSLGFPVRLIHDGLMLLLAFAVVIALQAVGVVLVSAMLITPAAAAYLITDRLNRMLVLASILGMAAGVLGSFLSFLGNNLPTGPFMVLGSSFAFGMAFLFAPRHGLIIRVGRRFSRSKRIQRENTLKAVYHILEEREFHSESILIRELAERRRETVEQADKEATQLERHGLATRHEEGNVLALTPEGWQRACEIVRNHRLWELYLTNAAQIAADHVHEDAEKIEHVLGAEVVMQLEKRLQYAKKDPHGRPIPSLRDIRMGSRVPEGPRRLAGYGKEDA